MALHPVMVRLTAEELAWLDEEASRQNRSRSQILRLVLLSAVFHGPSASAPGVESGRLGTATTTARVAVSTSSQPSKSPGAPSSKTPGPGSGTSSPTGPSLTQSQMEPLPGAEPPDAKILPIKRTYPREPSDCTHPMNFRDRNERCMACGEQR